MLPHGFDKQTAPAEIAVRGAARDDPAFDDRGDRVGHSVAIGAACRPIQVSVELWYQPVSYRWAQNLAAYDAPEPHRFTSWFNAMAPESALQLAAASAVMH